MPQCKPDEGLNADQDFVSVDPGLIFDEVRRPVLKEFDAGADVEFPAVSWAHQNLSLPVILQLARTGRRPRTTEIAAAYRRRLMRADVTHGVNLAVLHSKDAYLLAIDGYDTKFPDRKTLQRADFVGLGHDKLRYTDQLNRKKFTALL
jgi:hypothetical protein